MLQSSLRIHFGLCKVKKFKIFFESFFRLYGKIIRIKKNDETNIERMSEVRKVRGALIGLVCLLTCTLPVQADEVTGAVKVVFLQRLYLQEKVKMNFRHLNMPEII